MRLFAVQNDSAKQTAYDFAFTALTGSHPLPLAQFRGQVLLVVNTASRCAFTPQYEGLENLYRKYQSGGFSVLGVPCNDFGGQEQGDSEDVLNFCQVNYKVSFPLAEKVHASGSEAHPFYSWVSSQAGFFGRPRWNFYKYLIDRHGRLAAHFTAITPPGSARLQRAINIELKKS